MFIYRSKLIVIMIAIGIVTGLTGCERRWTGDVKGSVMDVDTTTPIPGVLLTASSEKNSFAITTTSDADGKFRLSDLRWGPNRVTAYHPDYETEVQYADVVRNKTVSLEFELEEDPVSLDSTVLVWATNSDLVPIENVRVDLYRIDREDDEYVYFETKQTDSGGYIRFDLASISEDEIEFYEVRLAVIGYYNQSREFSSSWIDLNPEVHVIMVAAQ